MGALPNKPWTKDSGTQKQKGGSGEIIGECHRFSFSLPFINITGPLESSLFAFTGAANEEASERGTPTASARPRPRPVPPVF